MHATRSTFDFPIASYSFAIGKSAAKINTFIAKILIFHYGLINYYTADINECEVGAANCAPDATCVNTLGSFECQCNEGFVGDGRTVCVGELNARY